MKRKQDAPSDGELFNLFRDHCSNDEDANDAVREARKAFTYISKDKLYRDTFKNEEL